MEYVVPLIILLVVVIVVVVGARLIGSRNRPEQDSTLNESSAEPGAKGPAAKEPGVKKTRHGRDITREDAKEASVRLTPETHRRVYSLIAQHQVLNAVKEYRKATRTGLGEAAAAVAALAQFPQPTPEPASKDQGITSPAPSPAAAGGPLTVADIINAGPAAEDSVEAPKSERPAAELAADLHVKPAAAKGHYRYRAIVSQGDEVREVASTRLNAEIYAQIRQLALSGNYDGAAHLLRNHAEIGVADAQEFVSMISPED
ncbi:hypothetical protein [Arthrobacter sp. lap29]|uniref:hypothetical protein n=1 Tax=Arthrobacter sp. lap29 TaxID=3056122 RepID=UPI0028F6C59C|nr:hypothetical protein [Arthrobacter sp. lap29]